MAKVTKFGDLKRIADVFPQPKPMGESERTLLFNLIDMYGIPEVLVKLNEHKHADQFDITIEPSRQFGQKKTS